MEAAIHYDLPLSMNDFARREGRYRRYGRTEPCRVFVMEDASEASPLEAYLSRNSSGSTSSVPRTVSAMTRASYGDSASGTRSSYESLSEPALPLVFLA